jgi:MgtC family
MFYKELAPPGRFADGVAVSDEEFARDRVGVINRLRTDGHLDFAPAVLDPRHIGDIRGSLGTISMRDRAPRRTWWKRLVTLAAIVGFLGAGLILRPRINVTGISTAATIWCSAAIGTLCGAGYLVQAIIGSILVVLVHLILRPIARQINRLPRGDEVPIIYRFRAICHADDEAHIRALVVQALAGGDFRSEPSTATTSTAVRIWPTSRQRSAATDATTWPSKPS